MKYKEIKARKAKFGFDFGTICVKTLIDMGKFLEALQTVYSSDMYMAEDAGYNQAGLKVYTDNEEVAAWIRKYNT